MLRLFLLVVGLLWASGAAAQDIDPPFQGPLDLNCTAPQGKFDVERYLSANTNGDLSTLDIKSATHLMPGDSIAGIEIRGVPPDAAEDQPVPKIRAFLQELRPNGQPAKARRDDILGVVERTRMFEDGEFIGYRVDVRMPQTSLWGVLPKRHLTVVLCNADGLSIEAIGSTTVQVSNALHATLVAVAIVLLVYCGTASAVAYRRWKRLNGGENGRRYEWRASYLLPWSIASGISGRSSISNLQVLMFSTVVGGLMVHLICLTGEISTLSESVAGLLGIVGAGTASAQLVARSRDQLEPSNLHWMRHNGWIQHDPSLGDLVTVDGDFAPTRFQSIVFSLVVLIGLVIQGSGALSTFEVPPNVLLLIGASQLVYVGGKFASTGAASEAEREAYDKLNTLLGEVQEQEAGLRQSLDPQGGEGTLETLKALPDFPAYRKKTIEAAQMATQLLGIDMPETALFGVRLFDSADLEARARDVAQVNGALEDRALGLIQATEWSRNEMEAALALVDLPYDALRDGSERLAAFRAALILGKESAAEARVASATAAGHVAELGRFAEAWLEVNPTAYADQAERTIRAAAAAAAEAPLEVMAGRLRDIRQTVRTQGAPLDRLARAVGLAADLVADGIGAVRVPTFDMELALSAGRLYDAAKPETAGYADLARDAVVRLREVAADDALTTLRKSIRNTAEADNALWSLRDNAAFTAALDG